MRRSFACSERARQCPALLVAVGLLAWFVAAVAWVGGGGLTAPPHKYRWNDVECDDRAPFACKVNGAFEHHGKQKKWQEAREFCQERGGDLASIHSSADEDLLYVGTQPDELWIGLSDRTYECQSDGDCFVWSDGSPNDFGAWRAREPNDKQGSGQSRSNSAGQASDERPGEDCVMSSACNLGGGGDKCEGAQSEGRGGFMMLGIGAGAALCGAAACFSCAMAVGDGSTLLVNQGTLEGDAGGIGGA
jgi:hypothetical protein